MVHKSNTHVPSGGGGGVSSLNGETGDITITSSDGSINVSAVGTTVDITTAAGGATGRTTSSLTVAMTNSDGIVNITGTSTGAVAVTGAAGRTAWKPYTIKDAAGNAGANNATYTPDSGTIDGMASILLQQNHDSLTIYSDGTNEFTM